MMLPDNFLTAPIASLNKDLPESFSAQNVIEIADALSGYAAAASMEEISNSNLVYWLNEGLHFAVKTVSAEATKAIGRVLYHIAERDPEAVITMLGNSIESGRFKGQTAAFVWLNELYIAMFEVENNAAIITINHVFSYLFDKASSDTLARQLGAMLTQSNEEGVEQGRNALLVLTLALSQSASHPFNQSETLLIATLLDKALSLSLSLTGSSLLEVTKKGIFKGKTLLYLMVTVLHDAAKDNPDVVRLICNRLINVIFTQNLERVGKAFFQIIDNGPNRGMSSLGVMLNSLLSGAYIEKNNQSTNAMILVLKGLYSVMPNETIAVLTKPLGNNGVRTLVQTLIAITEHEIDAEPIANLLSNFIMHDSEHIAEAFTQFEHFPKNTAQSFSPLQLLLAAYGSEGLSTEPLRQVIDQLAASKYAVSMLLTLPFEARAIFLEKYLKTHSVTDEMAAWLQQTKCDVFDPLLCFKAEEIVATSPLIGGSSFASFFHEKLASSNLDANSDIEAEDPTASPSKS